MTPPSPRYHLLAVGELLVDFISHEMSETLNTDQAEIFTRFQGGSPANLAANMARLGNRVALVACVGNDTLGDFLKRKVTEAGLDNGHLITSPTHPTSLVILSRTVGTPDFVAYREADCQLLPEHLPLELLAQTAIFHTTCFALSRRPAQFAIFESAMRAADLGCRLSLDVNYSPKIWPERAVAQRLVGDYCARRALIKLSTDDVSRLFADPALSPEAAIARFHDLGADLVCFTLGADGSLVSANGGREQVRVAAEPTAVVDATGAGDAYWAGFLTAWLAQQSLANCARAGARMAARKLARLGPLTEPVSPTALFD